MIGRPRKRLSAPKKPRLSQPDKKHQNELLDEAWIEDEIEASEQWEVNAATAHDAVKEATTYIRFPPHHVEAKLCLPTQEARGDDLRPGEARRHVPPF
jgi:hypothetical protein